MKMEPLAFNWSRNLNKWLQQHQCCIVISSYKRNKVISVGQHEDKICIWHSQFDRPMELAYADQKLYLGTSSTIISFTNNVKHNYDPTTKVTFDTNFVPKHISIIGDIDIHDIDVSTGEVYFVGALMNSICRLTPHHQNHFEIVWSPPFISRVAAEDRCHLNSFCLVDGTPKYATYVSDSDIHFGWKNNRIDQGAIMDVDTNEIVCSHLTMPHSVRVYQDTIYVLNSGHGQFGFINMNEPDVSKRFTPIAFIPGYLRSMKFIRNYAIIGSSLDRHETLFQGLPLNKILTHHNLTPMCGVSIINLDTHDIEHGFYIQNAMEIYGLEIIPDCETTRVLEPMSDILYDCFQFNT